MRIAMVSEHASPLAAIGGEDAGGQNVHVAALASALGRRGHEVVVYTRRDSPRLPARVPLSDGVVVEHVPAGPPSDVPKDELLPYVPAFSRYLAARWVQEPPDVVHSHFWMSGLACLHARAEVDVPLLHTYHALGTVKRRHQGSRDTSPAQRLQVEATLGQQADHVIATCSDEARELGKMGVPRHALSVVPCGVDVELFAPVGPRAARGGEAHRLLTVSRLVERKGVDDVIRALTRLPGAELVVAGGPDAASLDVDPYVERLRAVAANVGVADRVRFVGRVGRADMPALFRSADVVVCAPWYEPFGIVPLEAMACGVPVVAAAVGGLVDTVVDGVTGVLVPAREHRALARALRALLADPARRAPDGRAGGRRARARYHWDRIAADTAAIYAHAVRQPAGEREGALG